MNTNLVEKSKKPNFKGKRENNKTQSENSSINQNEPKEIILIYRKRFLVNRENLIKWASIEDVS